jgi:thioredoxin 1/putative thioredoxin
MPVREVSEREFVSDIMQSELPVLVEFGADWCGPCKTMLPELTALAQELDGKALVVKIDIDRSPMIARELGIQSVPTFVVFHNGRPVGAKTGAMKKAQLKQMIDPFLPRAAGAIKPEEAAALLAKKQIQFIDTRDAAVWQRVRLPGAKNIPLAEIEQRLAEMHMLPQSPVLYCRSGEQTKELAAKLAEAGVPVPFLEGGMLAWEAAFLPIERPD